MDNYKLINIILAVVTGIFVIIAIVLYANFSIPATIYNSAVETVTKVNLDNAEAQAQNRQFESYFGDNVPAIQVKQLLSFVKMNNSSSQSPDHPSTILVKIDGIPTSDASSIDSSKNYSIKVLDNNTDDSDPTNSNSKEAGYYTSGYIRTIVINTNN